MASVVLSGDTSGSVSLTVPAVAGTNTITFPAATGNGLTDVTCGVCRAWVNFNGTGTPAIRASYNVSSITDNGVGTYTINFTTAISDANYASPCSTNASGSGGVPIAGITSKSTTSCNMQTTNSSSVVDNSDNTVAIFR